MEAWKIKAMKSSPGKDNLYSKQGSVKIRHCMARYSNKLHVLCFYQQLVRMVVWVNISIFSSTFFLCFTFQYTKLVQHNSIIILYIDMHFCSPSYYKDEQIFIKKEGDFVSNIEMGTNLMFTIVCWITQERFYIFKVVRWTLVLTAHTCLQ